MPQKVPLMQLAFKTDANLDGGKLRRPSTTFQCWAIWDMLGPTVGMILPSATQTLKRCETL
jgi:hypothetical protein